jgi:hypothetical protein
VYSTQEEGPQDKLQTIWEGNVLSADRDAICAQSGDARMQAFQDVVDPWLTGTPEDQMPTEDDMTVFLADACPSTGVQTADPNASGVPSAPGSVNTGAATDSPAASGLPTSQASVSPSP